jgi:hypothetical protein
MNSKKEQYLNWQSCQKGSQYLPPFFLHFKFGLEKNKSGTLTSDSGGGGVWRAKDKVEENKAVIFKKIHILRVCVCVCVRERET